MSESNAVMVERPALGRTVAAEFVATFLFVFVSTGAVVVSSISLDQVGVALATGLSLAVLMAAVGRVSGGHVNPAVTLGAWTSRAIGTTTALAYVAAQLAGAIAGGLLLRFLVPGVLYTTSRGGVPTLGATMGANKGVALEATVTFVLVFAYLAVRDRQGGRATTTGLVVGLAAAANILAFGAYTGAAMNPARWLGAAFAAQQWDDWYVWIAGPLIGGVLAALVYRGLFGKQAEPAAAED